MHGAVWLWKALHWEGTMPDSPQGEGTTTMVNPTRACTMHAKPDTCLDHQGGVPFLQQDILACVWCFKQSCIWPLLHWHCKKRRKSKQGRHLFNVGGNGAGIFCPHNIACIQSKRSERRPSPGGAGNLGGPAAPPGRPRSPLLPRCHVCRGDVRP